MASVQEKKSIIHGGHGKVAMGGYIKKSNENFRLIRFKTGVPGRAGGQNKNTDPDSVCVYDMDEAKAGESRAWRNIIMTRLGWALVDGVLYDFRKE